MSPEETIHHAARIDAFLKDDVIAGALSRMERRFYEEFVAADSSEKRVTAWAKAHVLRTLEQEFRSVLDAGEMEVLRAAQKAKSSPSPRTE